MNNNFIEIVKAAQQGDNRAFEALYNMTKDSAYFIALSITKNEHDALDIMQDSYMKAFKNISTLNSPELFDNWLGRIVANTSKNYIKKKKPILFGDIGEGADIEWNDEEFNKDYLPQEAIDAKETGRLLMEIINRLSEDKRLCILMYYYQDMSVKEIAETLELPVSTVKYKLLSARAEIKKGVEELEDKGTKLYGLFPFILFPALFKNIETEFLKIYSSPEYASINLSGSNIGTVVTSQAAGNAAKKGFLATLKGKLVIAAVAVAAVGTGVAIAVNTTGNSGDSKSSGTSGGYADESVKNTDNEPISEDEPVNTVNEGYLSSDGLYRYKIDEGKAIIIAYYEPDTMTDLVVPEEIDGYTVWQINSFAFNGLEHTQSITLPDTITDIGENAFSDGSYIKVDYMDTVHNSMYNIYEYTKDDKLYESEGGGKYKNVNPSLKEVVFQGNNLRIIPISCFKSCQSLEKVTLPEGLKIISWSAFWDCSSLKSIEFPAGIEDIGYLSFYGCSSLTEVSIPKSVTNIGEGAFKNCNSLKKVYIEDGIQLEELFLKDSFIENNPFLEEIHIPKSFRGRFDFITYERMNFDDEELIPDYEKTKKSGILQYFKNITLYGEKGSLTEKISTDFGLNFLEEGASSSIPHDNSVDELDLPGHVIEIDGKKYTLPCDFSEFTKNGWSMTETDFDENTILKGYCSPPDLYEIVKEDDYDYDGKIMVGFTNIKEVYVKVMDSKIGRLYFETNSSVPIKLDDGFLIDSKLNTETVINKYGEPYSSEIVTYDLTDSLGDEVTARGDELVYQERKGDYIKVTDFFIPFEEFVAKGVPGSVTLSYEYSPE